MKTLGQLLKEARLAKNMSQFDVSLHLGFRSSDRISRWENDYTRPAVKNMLKLMDLYELPYKEVVECFVVNNQVPESVTNDWIN